MAATLQLPQRRFATETLSAEILPLADALRFLEVEGPRILAPVRPSTRTRPLWASGVCVELRREPLGTILVIGPSNYPLFLPAVQAVQALVAGNAVLVKPGKYGSAALALLAAWLVEAGLDADLCQVLGEDPAEATALLARGVAKVVLTGSVRSGRAVMSAAAQTLTPAVMELSGCDAAIVLPSAEIEKTSPALAFGWRLNGGQTCIAPRRVFVPRGAAAAYEQRLKDFARTAASFPVEANVAQHAGELIRAAITSQARLVCGSAEIGSTMQPLLLADVTPQMAIAQADIFAPVMSLLPYDDLEAVIAAVHDCPYALGASVFGEPQAALEVARRIDVGCVTVNDLIAPTADPRVPFGGRRQSGFGMTRGAEGLLEMTALKAIAIQTASWRPHLDPPGDVDVELIEALLQADHGATFGERIRGYWRLAMQGWKSWRGGKKDPSE